MNNSYKIDFHKNGGLVPAIIQDFNSGQILMLGYMSEESFQKTLEDGTVWFFSRSRNELWHKGETSGNYQIVKEIRLDCDEDTLLIKVHQIGGACHTGSYTASLGGYMEKIIKELYETIIKRKVEGNDGSYTKYLLDKGTNKILKKVGEECTEVVIACKEDNKEEQINEFADLIYHILVLMVDRNISIKEIEEELIKRSKKINNFKGERKNIEKL